MKANVNQIRAGIDSPSSDIRLFLLHGPDESGSRALADRLERAMGPDADKVNAYFVSVDPERDTLEMVKSYVEGFDPSVIGLVASSLEETENAKTAFGVFSEKAGEPGDPYYLVNHTALTFLVKADGTFQGTIAYEEDQDTAAAKVKRLVEG